MASGLPLDENGPPCYFPNFRDKQEAVGALKDLTFADGVYLIRKSTSEKDAYTLTVTYKGGICHKRIAVHKNNTFSIQSKAEFHSMGALLAHYKTNDIPNEQNIKQLRLLRPLTVLGNGTRGKTVPIPQGLVTKYDIYAYPPGLPKSVPPRRPGGGRLDARSIDNNAEDADLNPDGLLSPQVLSRRPPAPLPGDCDDTPTYSGSHYYYTPTDEECNRLPELRKLLELDEDMRKRCTCGLLVSESSLPEGWQVHRSHDAPTKGRIFFVSPDSRSHWNLPDYISKQCSEKQRRFLSQLFLTDNARSLGVNIKGMQNLRL